MTLQPSLLLKLNSSSFEWYPIFDIVIRSLTWLTSIILVSRRIWKYSLSYPKHFFFLYTPSTFTTIWSDYYIDIYNTHHGGPSINTKLRSLPLGQCTKACMQGLWSLSLEEIQGTFRKSWIFIYHSNGSATDLPPSSVTDQAHVHVVEQITQSASLESERRPMIKCIRKGKHRMDCDQAVFLTLLTTGFAIQICWDARTATGLVGPRTSRTLPP